MQVVLLALDREHDHRHGGDLADALQGLEAVHLRHHHVQQDQVGERPRAPSPGPPGRSRASITRQPSSSRFMRTKRTMRGSSSTTRISLFAENGHNHLCGNVKMKREPLPGRALHPDAPAVGLHDGARQVQAKSRALRRSGQAVLNPVESVEDVLLLVGSDAHARIGHVDRDPLAVGPPADRDRAAPMGSTSRRCSAGSTCTSLSLSSSAIDGRKVRRKVVLKALCPWSAV